MYLLTDSNQKTEKGQSRGYYTVILHLMPWVYSGYQVCPKANGCELKCLAFSGMLAYPTAQKAMLRRTTLFFEHRDVFMSMLVSDIWWAQEKARRLGMTLAVRLNGTSDIAWEKIRVGEYRNLMARFPAVQFYDYTKIFGRSTPDNYHLTFSYDGTNFRPSIQWLEAGGNVAVIEDQYDEQDWNGFRHVDGDEHDLRFLGRKNSVVLLSRKRTRNSMKEAA